jgi:hypothetical protein
MSWISLPETIAFLDCPALLVRSNTARRPTVALISA